MPKYLVTNGSHFTPFTYDDFMKPITSMQQAHDTAQEAYDTLDMQTNALGRYITDNPDDAQAKALYDSYLEKLNTLQNNLWENGVTAQTRRDLSVAKSGYASDITRLSQAIQARQERSKAYWDMKHKNPDLIMGADPGASGLDNYLNSDTYGQDYYAYSGRDFMNEVGADAKARAGEMLRNPEVMRNPELAGYLTTIQQDGFTSGEVQRASDAVRRALSGDASALESLDTASGILANVLMSHLETTGAYGNVSPDEFNRLVGYGISGLGQAIGKTDVRQVNDKLWDYNRQVALQNMRTAASRAGSSDKPDNRSLPYNLNDIASFLKSKEADSISKTIDKKFRNPFEDAVMITNPDGTPDVLTSPMDAERVLMSLGKDDFINKYGIEPDAFTGKRRMKDSLGNLIDVKIATGYSGSGDKPGDEYARRPFVVQRKDKNGKWYVDDTLSKQFTDDYYKYNDSVSNFEKSNPGVNLRGLAISGNERRKLYNQYGIPEDTNIGDALAIMQTKAREGYVTPATLADAAMGKTLERYQDIMYDAFGRGSHGKNEVAKTSDYAFYDVDDYDIARKAKGDNRKITEILPSKGSLKSISAYPEDIIQNRIRINANGREYAVNPVMLGNDVDIQVSKMRPVITELMSPITDPVKALNMSPDEAARWCYMVSAALGDYMRIDSYDESGRLVDIIKPSDVVRNERLQEMLRTAVTRYMNNGFGFIRDNMMMNNQRIHGDSSDKATGYNDYLY